MANQEDDGRGGNEVYDGKLPFYMERIGMIYFMLNAYNSKNTIFDCNSTPDTERDIIPWTKKDVKQYIVALRLGTGLFFTSDGKLIADNYEFDRHEFEGDDVAAAIQPVRWSKEPNLFICCQSQPKVFAKFCPYRFDGDFEITISGMTDSESERWTQKGGPVFHNPPFTREDGRVHESALDNEQGDIFIRTVEGGLLDNEPQFLNRLRLNGTFRTAITSHNNNITGDGLPLDMLHLEWGQRDMGVYRTAKKQGRSIVVSSDGKLHVEHDDENEDEDKLLEEGGNTPGEGVLDDSWHSDFEPNVYINDEQSKRCVALVPINGSLIRADAMRVSGLGE